MKDYYQVRYQTGKRSIVGGGIAIAVAVLFLLLGLAADASGMLPVCIIIVLFTLGCEFNFLKRYREMLLYDDRLEVVTLFEGVVLSLPFSDIRHIGFLKAHTDYGYHRRLSQGAVESVDVSELIILTEGNGRHEFCDDDYDHLGEVCTFIRHRTGL